LVSKIIIKYVCWHKILIIMVKTMLLLVLLFFLLLIINVDESLINDTSFNCNTLLVLMDSTLATAVLFRRSVGVCLLLICNSRRRASLCN